MLKKSILFPRGSEEKIDDVGDVRDGGDIRPRKTGGNLFFVLLGQKHPFQTGLTGAVELFGDAADGADLPPDGDFPGHRQILRQGQFFQAAVNREKDGEARRGAVDVAAADDVDMDIVIGEVFPVSRR